MLEVDVDEDSIRIKNMISDWNISNTSLEEVFIKITG